MRRQAGYTFIILMVMITVLAIGLLVAVPVWQTQIQREAEEELIFRGRQYVEAVRLFQIKNPGKFPTSIEDLIKSRFLRKPFPDPMTRDGKWDLILQADGGGSVGRPARPDAPGAGPGRRRSPALRQPGSSSCPRSRCPRWRTPASSASSAARPQTSLRIYNDQDTYDTWLFFYGQTPDSKPEIIRFGRADK